MYTGCTLIQQWEQPKYDWIFFLKILADAVWNFDGSCIYIVSTEKIRDYLLFVRPKGPTIPR